MTDAAEPPQLIYAALAKAMGEVQPAPQDGENTFFRYRYASVSSVYTVASRALAKHGICVVSNIAGEEWFRVPTKQGEQQLCRLHVEHTFYAEDGSSVSVVNIGEGTDAGDKAANKAWQAARKFALIVTLCIPTDAEETDGDVTEMQDRPQRDAPAQPRTVKRMVGRRIVEEPVPPPAVEEGADRISDAHRKGAMAIFSGAGVKDRAERLQLTAMILHRQLAGDPLTSTDDLTHAQGEQLLAELRRLSRTGPNLRAAIAAYADQAQVDTEGAEADNAVFGPTPDG